MQILKRLARKTKLHLAPETLESRLNLSTLTRVLAPPAPSALMPVRIVGAPSTPSVKAAALPVKATALPIGGASVVSGQTNVPIDSYSAIANSRLELQAGQAQSDIGYVSASGAYVEYTIAAPSAGTYSLTLGLASYSSAKVQVSVNGNVQSTIQASPTNSWTSYINGTTKVQLAAGTNVIRFGSQNGTQYNINAITLTPMSPIATTTTTTSTTTSTSTPVSSVSQNVTNIGDNTWIAIPSYSGIWNSQLEYLTYGPDIGYVAPSGAYVEYTINVATAGNYTLTAGIANLQPASLDVSSNATKITSFASPATGDWQSFGLYSQTVYLNAGQQVLRFTATHGTQYNVGAIQLVRQITPAPITTPIPAPVATPTPATTPAPTSAPMPNPMPIPTADTRTPVSISQRWMTSFNEIDVVGTTGNDSIYVTQSGGLLNITANGISQQLSAYGELVIWGGNGNDTITVDSSVNIAARIYGGKGDSTLANLTRGPATIVSIGGGTDRLTGNGTNTSFWADSADNVLATAAEIANGGVHIVNAFYQPYTTISSAPGYVPLQLNGPNLVDPASGAPASTRLTNRSFFGMGPAQEDINQGNASDCYLLTTLQSLARLQPGQLRQMGVDLGDGTYAIAFKRGGQTQFVRVDGDLPSNSAGVYYNRTGVSGNQWASLFEKAYAFFRTGKNDYSSLNYGFMTPVYNDLGVAANNYTLPTDQNAFYSLASSKLASGYAVDICTNPSIVNNAPLVANHTYSILSTWRDGSGTVWVTLRNPWGSDGFSVDSNPWDGMITLDYAVLKANVTFGTVMV